MSQLAGEDGSDREARKETVAAEQVTRFVASLTPEERLLVRIKAELYEGSWDELVADLEARLSGRPYGLKLASRIEDDLVRVAKLRQFEKEQNIALEAFC